MKTCLTVLLKVKFLGRTNFPKMLIIFLLFTIYAHRVFCLHSDIKSAQSEMGAELKKGLSPSNINRKQFH